MVASVALRPVPSPSEASGDGFFNTSNQSVPAAGQTESQRDSDH
jgi:hypothetical protein